MRRAAGGASFTKVQFSRTVGRARVGELKLTPEGYHLCFDKADPHKPELHLRIFEEQIEVLCADRTSLGLSLHEVEMLRVRLSS